MNPLTDAHLELAKEMMDQGASWEKIEREIDRPSWGVQEMFHLSPAQQAELRDLVKQGRDWKDIASTFNRPEKWCRVVYGLTPYSEEDDMILRAGIKRRKTWVEIAERLRRGKDSVRLRAQALGLIVDEVDS